MWWLFRECNWLTIVSFPSNVSCVLFFFFIIIIILATLHVKSICKEHMLYP